MSPLVSSSNRSLHGRKALDPGPAIIYTGLPRGGCDAMPLDSRTAPHCEGLSPIIRVPGSLPMPRGG